MCARKRPEFTEADLRRAWEESGTLRARMCFEAALASPLWRKALADSNSLRSSRG